MLENDFILTEYNGNPFYSLNGKFLKEEELQ